MPACEMASIAYSTWYKRPNNIYGGLDITCILVNIYCQTKGKMNTNPLNNRPKTYSMTGQLINIPSGEKMVVRESYLRAIVVFFVKKKKSKKVKQVRVCTLSSRQDERLRSLHYVHGIFRVSLFYFCKARFFCQ